VGEAIDALEGGGKAALGKEGVTGKAVQLPETGVWWEEDVSVRAMHSEKPKMISQERGWEKKAVKGGGSCESPGRRGRGLRDRR
jgi:hypothetical protein